MRKIIVVGILVLTVAMAAPAMAFEKGTIRLGAGTGLINTSSGFQTRTLDPDVGSSVDYDTLGFELGYFLTDTVEVVVDFSNVDVFGGAEVDGFGLTGKYYFPMGKNTIYAGGGIQSFDVGGTDGDVIFVTGGYNYMLKDYFSIDFYLALGQGDENGNDFDMTDIGVTYSVYFK